jgi:hypothetical protein
MTTVMGLFDEFSEAQRVISALLAHGVQREAISLVANREGTAVLDVVAVGAWGVNVEVGPASRGQPAALIELGVSADEVELYAEGLARGGALVSVDAADDQVEPVVELMEPYTSEHLTATAAPW